MFLKILVTPCVWVYHFFLMLSKPFRKKHKIEKINVTNSLNNLGENIINAPEKVKKVKEKNKKGKEYKGKVPLEPLRINFDGEDAKKSDKKLTYQYLAKNSEGKMIKGYFDAFSKVEVNSYLMKDIPFTIYKPTNGFKLCMVSTGLETSK